MLNHRSKGIHHVTAIAADGQRNVDFYTGVLGLRLVKRTVNFDAPESYHLYYGDALGNPGTILTFFVWPGAQAGRAGYGEVSAVTFAVPPDSLTYWKKWFDSRGVSFREVEGFSGEKRLAFKDPDGLELELAAIRTPSSGEPWAGSPVPAKHAIRGIYSVTLLEANPEDTTMILKGLLGFQDAGQTGDYQRLETGGEGPGAVIEISSPGDVAGSRGGSGTIHHVAFRSADDEEQSAIRKEIIGKKISVTEQLDRKYFRSIYFREPGGVLFEVATDPPGFTVDETPNCLGSDLKLPDQYEPMRAKLEASLPPLKINEIPKKKTNPARPAGFVHHWSPGRSSTSLILLHGTGGSEKDLVPLGTRLAPHAALLSPRGKINENGMARYFRRIKEGVFDPEDLRYRSHELAGFILEASKVYGFSMDQAYAVGYSNGANIATSMMLIYPRLFGAAVLFRPMLPFESEVLPDFQGLPILISAGINDPIVPMDDVEQLAAMFSAAKAHVTVHWQDGEHSLTEVEILEAERWLDSLGIDQPEAASSELSMRGYRFTA